MWMDYLLILFRFDTSLIVWRRISLYQGKQVDLDKLCISLFILLLLLEIILMSFVCCTSFQEAFSWRFSAILLWEIPCRCMVIKDQVLFKLCILAIVTLSISLHLKTFSSLDVNSWFYVPRVCCWKICRRNMELVLDFLLGDAKHKLLFCWVRISRFSIFLWPGAGASYNSRSSKLRTWKKVLWCLNFSISWKQH